MKATVIKAFRGAKDGEHYPVEFKPGDTVEGELAKVAVAEKWARVGKGKPAPEGDAADGAQSAGEGGDGEPAAAGEPGLEPGPAA